ncbi:MAG: pilus assembly protein PilM [bacterium]
MFLHNPFPNAFGLEIGDLSIKLVQLQPVGFSNTRLKVKEIRTCKLPAGLIVNGDVQQPELVRKKLLYLLGLDKNKKYKPIKIPWVVASLPEVKTFLKLITIEMEQEELTHVDVLYQAKKHLPFALEEAYVNWQSTSATEEGYSQVLVGAIPKITADSYNYLLASLNLIPLSLEIEAVSLIRAMITAEKNYHEEARAILDLGATRSSLVIYDNSIIQFSTSLNYSGELVTTALEQKLKITHQQAEELKINNGAKYDPKQSAYLETISKINDQLIEELDTAMSFYKQHFDNQNPINHITMCGGMSNWKGLNNLISRKLKISSHPGNAWKNLAQKNPNKNQADGLSLAVAIGLALKATQRPFII